MDILLMPHVSHPGSPALPASAMRFCGVVFGIVRNNRHPSPPDKQKIPTRGSLPQSASVPVSQAGLFSAHSLAPNSSPNRTRIQLQATCMSCAEGRFQSSKYRTATGQTLEAKKSESE